MDDLTEIDSGLDFNNSYKPEQTHTNWLWGKMQEYTMVREAAIKGEIMDLDWKQYLAPQLESILMAAFAQETKSLAEEGSVSTFYPFLASIVLTLFSEKVRQYFKGHKNNEEQDESRSDSPIIKGSA